MTFPVIDSGLFSSLFFDSAIIRSLISVSVVVMFLVCFSFVDNFGNPNRQFFAGEFRLFERLKWFFNQWNLQSFSHHIYSLELLVRLRSKQPFSVHSMFFDVRDVCFCFCFQKFDILIGRILHSYNQVEFQTQIFV